MGGKSSYEGVDIGREFIGCGLGAAVRSRAVLRDALETDRSVSGRARIGGRRNSGQCRGLLHGNAGWRSLEDRRRRGGLEADLRPGASRLDRRGCRRAFESRHRVCGHRRRQQCRRRGESGQGRLQIRGCGPDLEARRAGRFAPHREHVDRSAQSRHRLRCRAGPHLRAQRATGRVQDDGWRQNVAQGSL